MKEEFVKGLIMRTLKFWFNQTKVDGCTREQKLMFADFLSTETETWATIQEIADFYGKSKDAVYGVIKRKYIGKPRRNVVMYSLTQFDKIVPDSWREKDDKSET